MHIYRNFIHNYLYIITFNKWKLYIQIVSVYTIYVFPYYGILLSNKNNMDATWMHPCNNMDEYWKLYAMCKKDTHGDRWYDFIYLTSWNRRNYRNRKEIWLPWSECWEKFGYKGLGYILDWGSVLYLDCGTGYRTTWQKSLKRWPLFYVNCAKMKRKLNGRKKYRRIKVWLFRFKPLYNWEQNSF
jgi:hypothetical protein